MPPWAYGLIGFLLLLALFGVWLELKPQHRFIDSAGDKDPAELKKWLAQGVDVNKPGFMGLTAVSVAASEGRVDNLRLLLEHGADPNRSAKLVSILGLAVDNKRPEVAKALLEHGADPFLSGRLGRSAIEVASLTGQVDILQSMVANGARLDAKCPDGEPLLIALLVHIGCEKKESSRVAMRDSLRFFVENGANLNVRSSHDLPAICLAMDDIESLRIMVDAGAITDVSFKGRDFDAMIKDLLASNSSSPRL